MIFYQFWKLKKNYFSLSEFFFFLEMTSQQVDSDLRTLFAFGKLDDFEKLKKENGECAIVLKGIEARIQDRLKIFRNMSPREVSLRCQGKNKILIKFYLW